MKKQYKWLIGLGSAAVVLTGIYFLVDAKVSDKEKRAAIGGPKTLFSFDADSMERITIDNEDGSYCFDWNKDGGFWELTSDDKFAVNVDAVRTICGYFCQLSSEKTVAFDCENTSQFGFDNPVTLKVYTSETGEDDPYVLYVGDNTPTFDAYYVMVGGSNDVYTVDYTTGSIFCVAKDTLKDLYLFDAFSTMVDYYKLERDGKTVVELKRDAENIWNMSEPAGFSVYRSEIENMINNLVRLTVTGFVEENPEDLAKYGLDKPEAKIYIKGMTMNGISSEEIWFGKPISESPDETDMYGYFANTKQVFTILRNEMGFLKAEAVNYVEPYCTAIEISEVSAVHVDMGDIADMNCTLLIDYANEQYSFNDTDITALKDDAMMDKFQTLFRELSAMRFTDLDMDAEPQGEAAATITFDLLEGGKRTVEFIPESSNNFYVMVDGKYTNKTIRMNRFTGAGGLIRPYNALVDALKALK